MIEENILLRMMSGRRHGVIARYAASALIVSLTALASLASLGGGDLGRWVLLGLKAAAVGLLWAWLSKAENRLTAVALGAVVGGAVGNVIDRLRFGAVVDFVDAHGWGWHWYVFNLADADLTTAMRVADAINSQFGYALAVANDAVSVRIAAPVTPQERVLMMSRIENVPVTPAEAAAKVIVNARTGTVVINGAVRIGPAAVSHGKLTVKIDENQRVSQPAPLSGGQTVVTPKSGVAVEEERRPMFLLNPGPKLADVVKAVNAIGAAPSDLVAILEALKEAGALKAELIVL